MPTAKRNLLALIIASSLVACTADDGETLVSEDATPAEEAAMGKPVVYQVFTRLFGNKVTTNKPWGTIEENGVGKFEDFTDKALAGIRELGLDSC